jgi:hypothetical protein
MSQLNPVCAPVIRELEQYMSQGGGSYSAWYCGIASSPRNRLFNDHNVRERGDYWIYRDCGNDTIARQIESYFHNSGCQGSHGGGDDATKFVYCYKITNSTVE